MCVVGARPNYMTTAPLIRAFNAHSGAPPTLLVHTGQHYDVAMSDQLFADLRLPAPDINLEVGSGTHAVQTAEIMRRIEPVIDSVRPSCLIVVGDVNSTLACSRAAKGFRGARRGAAASPLMPGETNRLPTDQIADVSITERSAAENLRREGIAPERIHFVGNVMIDSLLASRDHAVSPRTVLARNGIDASLLDGDPRFGLVTLHRPSNVDQVESLTEALAILRDVSDRLPLICPLHPRTRGNIERYGLERLIDARRVVVLPPQGYLEMVGLMAAATVVLTDSGGVQEETTALGVACLTMRENTERPITVEQGTNVLIGRDRALARECVRAILDGGGKRGRAPELWDGRAAPRIAAHLAAWLAERTEAVAC
jgi:UDP-N-acetylglucosamine 2-epimerase (non-hydrolysing)